MGRSAAVDGAVLARNNLLRALGAIRCTEGPATERARNPFGGPTPEKLFLVGFMGCGKSTVGEALARRLGWRFVDLDIEVEERAGLTIPKIFLSLGERRFRRLEFEALRDVTRATGYAVVALGGGAFVSEVNRRLVERAGMSVWLDVPLRVLAQRVERQGGRRPLAKSPERLQELLRSRLPFYHEADVRIRAGNARSDAVVRAIVRAVEDDWPVVVERRRLRL